MPLRPSGLRALSSHTQDRVSPRRGTRLARGRGRERHRRHPRWAALDDGNRLRRSPEVALAWGWRHPGWIQRYARAADRYEARLHDGHPVGPASLAEEVLLRGAFDAARLEPDPDGALPPAALVLPRLPGDYAWARAAEQVGFRPDLHVLYDPMAGPLIGADDALHPIRWFEPYAAR